MSEWRFITGQVGPKHYLDDALRRVFLGPRVKPEHPVRVCDVMDRRPVEVLQGVVKGFTRTFRTIKPARPLEQCERVGACRFNPAEHLWAEKELREFLAGPFDVLVEECRRTALRPNMEVFSSIDISYKGAICLWTKYKLRSGRDVYHKRYFDRRFRLLPGES